MEVKEDLLLILNMFLILTFLEIQPKNGYDIITTINVNLQDIAESALLKGLELNDADYGSEQFQRVFLPQLSLQHLKS